MNAPAAERILWAHLDDVTKLWLKACDRRDIWRNRTFWWAGLLIMHLVLDALYLVLR